MSISSNQQPSRKDGVFFIPNSRKKSPGPVELADQQIKTEHLEPAPNIRISKFTPPKPPVFDRKANADEIARSLAELSNKNAAKKTATVIPMVTRLKTLVENLKKINPKRAKTAIPSTLDINSDKVTPVTNSRSQVKPEIRATPYSTPEQDTNIIAATSSPVTAPKSMLQRLKEAEQRKREATKLSEQPTDRSTLRNRLAAPGKTYAGAVANSRMTRPGSHSL